MPLSSRPRGAAFATASYSTRSQSASRALAADGDIAVRRRISRANREPAGARAQAGEDMARAMTGGRGA